MHTPDITIADASRSQNLIKQAAGALAWGTFFILTPWELLFIGSIAWLPLLLYYERELIKQYGAWPGPFIRVGVIAAVAIGAAIAPTKYEDQRVGPLTQAKVSLADLVAKELLYRNEELGLDAVQIMLPSTTPTIREVMQAIEQQTNFQPRIPKCGNGATLLFGTGGGRISLRQKVATE